MEWSNRLQVYYTRHAYSKWNKYCEEHPGSENIQVPLPKLIDPSITKNQGQAGCAELASQIRKAWGLDPVHPSGSNLSPYIEKLVVFVSPHTRALETCEKMFQSPDATGAHPHVTVYVHPGLQSRVNHTTDLALRWNEKVAGNTFFNLEYIKEYQNDLAWQYRFYLDILAQTYNWAMDQSGWVQSDQED